MQFFEDEKESLLFDAEYVEFRMDDKVVKHRLIRRQLSEPRFGMTSNADSINRL